MNQQTETLLRELAAKFGTTVEHLWQVLVKQAYIEGATTVAMWIMWCGILVWACRFCLKLTGAQPVTDDNPYGRPMLDFTECVMLWFAFCIVALCCLVGFTGSISSMVGCFFNPEYWALKQILK